MKPLSVDELKALEVGDWVWIESDLVPNWNKFYAKKIPTSKDYANKYLELATQGCGYTFFYSAYGKTWLAYKNKEQAEAKGEIVELPCKIDDSIWVVYRHYDNGYEDYDIAETVCIGFGITKQGVRITTNFICHEYDRIGNFIDKAEAKRRLTELKGEKL